MFLDIHTSICNPKVSIVSIVTCVLIKPQGTCPREPLTLMISCLLYKGSQPFVFHLYICLHNIIFYTFSEEVTFLHLLTWCVLFPISKVVTIVLYSLILSNYLVFSQEQKSMFDSSILKLLLKCRF